MSAITADRQRPGNLSLRAQEGKPRSSPSLLPWHSSALRGQPLPQSPSQRLLCRETPTAVAAAANIQRLDEPAIPQTPDYSSGCNNCARPTPPQVKVVDGAGCSNCAVETLDKPIIPVEPADAGGCSSCATPTSPTQKIADNSATVPIAPSKPDDSGQSHLADYPNDGCAKFAHPGQRAAA